MVALLLALLFAPWLAPLPPDVLPPGHKGVRHEILLEWEEQKAQRFVAYPTRGFHVHHEIEPGQPFTFSSKYGTRIYAVPAGATFPEQRDEVAAKQWPNAPVPVAQISSVAAGNPLARVESRVRVENVTANDIEFRVLGERRLDGSGNELGDFNWLVLALIAGVGLLFVVVLTRRARSPTPAAA